MVSTSLTPLTSSQEERLKKSLKQSLTRRKEKLHTIITHMEALQVELDLIAHEYYVRIGNLLLQDNELDLQILQYRQIVSLMESGRTYEEACKDIEHDFYAQILREQEEKRRIEEEQTMLGEQKQISEPEAQELKTLWRKLIRQFHPDLVSDPEEKMKREKIMQHINHAYAANDMDALQRLMVQPYVPVLSDASLTELEKALEETEQMITVAEHTFAELKQTSWYRWRSEMKKAKKQGKDVFLGLENSLIDDLLKKIAIARELQDRITQLQSTPHAGLSQVVPPQS